MTVDGQTELPDFSAKFIEGESVYFYQAQPEIALPENGKGYCWVCSYAMMFSNMLKTVITPMEIAQYNIDRGYAGNYIAGHADLALSYGLRHIPAISEDSPYYVGFNVRNRGETEVFCETDEDARIVMREAIDKFPQGV